MGASEYISFAVLWVPSIIFLMIICGSTLIGMKRGYRKSLILFIQSIIAFSLCLIIYLCLVNFEFVDVFLLNLANMICKLFANKDLPSLLGISSSGTHLKEVITDFIIIRMDFGDMINIMLSENTAYIYALINFIYHIAFAIFMWFIYQIFIFILYIVYLIFLSTRKYKKKINEKFSSNLADGSYRKKPGRGALVGCIRGLISGLISLSFLGSALYMVAGKGEGSLNNYDFGDPTINEAYSMYRSFDKYGTTGIYKVLNAIDNDDDVPLYLFAADLVLQGSYVEVDEDTGEENKIQLSLRSELGVYTEFAREAGNLFLKFGGDRIRSLILGESDEDPFYLIMDIFSEPEFQSDFQIAISKISDSKYINKLAFSLIDSYLGNIDKMGVDVPEDLSEISRIIFKRGYYSSVIPEEKALASSGKMLPYISSSDIILSSDISTILRAFYVLVDGSILEGEEFDPAILIRQLLPYIRSLSLFDIRENNPINPVLGRVFMFCENTYLKDLKLNTGDDTSNKKYLSEIELEAYQTLINNYKIDYVKEINALLDSADAITEMYNNVYDPEKEVLDVILSIFDEEGANYTRNIELFNQLLDTLTSSQLLGKVLGSAGIVSIIEDSFSAISKDFKLPASIHFANTYDDNGNLVEYGELYNVLCGLKELSKKENKEFITSLLEGSDTFSLESLQTLAGSINKVNERGETLCDYITSSKIINSIITNLLYENNGSSGTIIFIPQVALEEENGEKILLLKKKYFADVLSRLEEIFDLVEPILNDPENIDNIYKIINDPNILDLLNNPIIQATFANQIIINEEQIDFFIISNDLHDANNWVSQEDGEMGELVTLIRSVLTLNIDFSKIAEFNVIECINKLSYDQISELFNSQVLLYSISDFVLNYDDENLTIIVPKESLFKLTNDAIDYIVYPKELIKLFDNLKLLDEEDTIKLLSNVISDKDNILSSNITSATMSYYIYDYLCQDEEIKYLIPDSLYQDGENLKTQIKTLKNTYESNLWSSELENLLYALDEIFNVSSDENATIDFDNLETKIEDIINKSYATGSSLKTGKTKLAVVYDSLVIKNSITESLDEVLVSSFTYEENKYVSDIITHSKENGYYKYEEIYALCDIIRCLEIEGGINGLQEYDFESIEINDSNKDRIIKNIKSSLIIRGTISGAIYESCFSGSNPILKDHPYCYDSDIDKNSGIDFDSRFAIFTSNELESLINIISGYKFNEIKISQELINKCLSYIKNDKNQCSSYVLVSTITSYVFDADLLVPIEVIQTVDKQNFISNIELYYLVYSLNGINGLDIFNESESTVDTKISLEGAFIKENVDIIKKSKILNLYISQNLKIDGAKMYVKTSQAETSSNYKDKTKIALINEEEFKYLLNAFIILSPNGELSFTFNIYTLIGVLTGADSEEQKNNIVETIVSSSVITIYLCDSVLKPYKTIINMKLDNPPELKHFLCYELPYETEVTKEIYDKDGMTRILSNLGLLISN